MLKIPLRSNTETKFPNLKGQWLQTTDNSKRKSRISDQNTSDGYWTADDILPA